MSELTQEPIKNGAKTGIDTRFKPGNPGGPGRPKGSFSIKDMVRKHLEDHPGELKKFVQHFIDNNRELAWQMLEGKPQQDVTTGGEKLPAPIYGGLSAIPEHNSDTEDISTEEKV